ncbi:MAG TPA: hypothetical protein VFB90_00610 [Dehalococcoidia bacterium]|nr:hypothetical protein [Dehalococcoidia bacterium]
MTTNVAAVIDRKAVAEEVRADVAQRAQRPPLAAEEAFYDYR